MKNTREGQLQDEIPSVLPIVPTIDVVVFPNMVVPLLVLDEKIIQGINHALNGSKKILLLAARQKDTSYRGPIGIQDLYTIGTVANIIRVMNLPDRGIKILTQGVVRAQTEDIVVDQDILQVAVKPLLFQDSHEEDCVVKQQIDEAVRRILTLTEKLGAQGKTFGPDFQTIIGQIQNPERISDFVLSHLNLNVSQAQTLLERSSLLNLLQGITEILENEIELSTVKEKIRINAREAINRSQREYYLREQLKAIQKELGEETDSEVEKFRDSITHLPLSDEARSEAKKELRRLEKMSPESMEATVIRNHLEWLLGLPWGKFSKENGDIAKAQDIMNKKHYGLDLIKDRILDFLSVRLLKQDSFAPIVCFAGPPGVGKTSLGKSIAECMGRSFFRISLGGVQDESEVRGHRRTYVGALPGRFVQALRKTKTMNPVIMIDEIDKVGSNGKGDPSSALLEVLDPEQNTAFYDNYLGINIDLSKVVFITTANDLTNIPGPLRDRMEIIQLAGYTLDEKLEIAQQYLIKKAIQDSGLEDKGFELSEDTIVEMITGYTREAGVRDLERYVRKLCSKFARVYVQTKKMTHFSKDNLIEYLGPRRIPLEDGISRNRVGVTNGLAWTPYGGDVLQVEAVLVPGKGKLTLTGQLGSVMKESAQAAVTFARSHAKYFGIEEKLFVDYDLHIHLPAGAIPKDGPSAGITLLSSIFSVFTGREIDGSFAMTGELNLQGNVLPIGGLKEKILAAKQRGLKNVILPFLNKNDLVGLDKIFKDMNIIFVEKAEDVLRHVLLPENK